tara:strand:- start:1715 stop:2824 length:1110 start_codon:yes stop_codon:yes gene_type:complete
MVGMSLFPENFPEIAEVSSPALLFYPDRIQRNIDRMIAIAGDPGHLRPHIKTHKSAEVIRMQMECGIDRFKCATLAEAELLGKEYADDVLLAMQPVGPHIQSYIEIAKVFPESSYSVLLDNSAVIGQVNAACAESSMRLGAFLDLNVGMNRTGVELGLEAMARYKQLHEASYLDVKGLHVYDGHIKNADVCELEHSVNEAYDQVENFMLQLEKLGFAPPVVVAGGSPTFPIHAKRDGVELSPGTTLIWDYNYSRQFPEMEFENAAFLVSRVISKPTYGVVCFDLGHKAVASEMPHPRIHFQGIEDIEYIGHSEEHLVAKVGNWESIQVGGTYLGIPSHICPTVSLYDHVNVIEGQRVVGTWKNAARHRL